MDKRLSYHEMLTFTTYGDRLNYLRLWNKPHLSPRSLDTDFYHSIPWRQCRADIIRRDAGCDLGVTNCDINGAITVHHINPLTPDDLENWTDNLFDPDNLITVSLDTHNSIHYKPKVNDYIERTPDDIKLW